MRRFGVWIARRLWNDSTGRGLVGTLPVHRVVLLTWSNLRFAFPNDVGWSGPIRVARCARGHSGSLPADDAVPSFTSIEPGGTLSIRARPSPSAVPEHWVASAKVTVYA